MSRHGRIFLAIGLVAALGVERRGGAQDARREVITLATLAPPGSTWMRVFEAWGRELRRRSGGTLELRLYAGGVQGDEAEVIRKIRGGRLDAAAVTDVGLSQVHRPALVFALPGMFDDYQRLDAARDALAPEMSPAFERAGFVILGWADVGINRFFSTRRILRPADLTRAKPWVWSDDLVMPAFYRVVRASPLSLQVPEVLGALQTRRIDTFAAAPVVALSLQWASRVAFMTDVDCGITVGGTVVSKRRFDQLTPAQQSLLRETAQQYHALARRNLRRDEVQAVQALAQRNIEVVRPTPAHRAEWKRAQTETRERLVGQIADRALIDRVQSFAR